MKKRYVTAILLSFCFLSGKSQTPVKVGAGSYASFPPESENTDGKLYNFVYDKTIYVSDNEIRPIPTNDWWTDLIIEQYGGMLWAYPMAVDPESYGPRIYYPIEFIPEGNNLQYGGSLEISAEGYNPDKAIAKDWNDWGVVMEMPDETSGKDMEVTFAHGMPFIWIETKQLNPEFSFDRGATYLTEAGEPAEFPINESFVIQTDGRYLGVHLDGSTEAVIEGQQYVKIDLGSVQPINQVHILWEAAYASGYAIQVSDDDVNYTTVAAEINGDGGEDVLNVDASGRYVKVALSEKGTSYAYSIWEMEIYSGDEVISTGQPVEVTSVQGNYQGEALNDGNSGTRWAADPEVKERLVLNTNNSNDAYFVVSALSNPQDLTEFEGFAFNKPVNTEVAYDYDVALGKVFVDWNIEAENLKTGAEGEVMQGFIPHLYANADNNIAFTDHDYVTPRGTMKTAIGNHFSFVYDFGGILPSYNSPFKNEQDANPYSADVMFDLLTTFSKKQNYGGDTYWGGKDLVNFAKYTLMAKELDHQAYEALKAKTRDALVNWLTYTPGEEEKFFARYDRWGALVGFNESYGSSEFTDNHFHYGYIVYAAALYSMVDPDFLTEYGDIVKLVAKQYANWDKSDTFTPYFRTFDPWIGHSYAGGTSSSTGNNQESTSESMQSWIGLFLLGDMLDDESIRDAGAFGYISESTAILEYWFDWKERNLPAAYPHNMVGILANQGFAYGTFFSASPVHIHGIQYLPVNPGFKYLAKDKTWAAREYNDMMVESAAIDGHENETDFGDDWAQVALGFRLLFDPQYVAAFIDDNLKLEANDEHYIMDYEVSGMTYFYTHANQNLGDFSFVYRTNFPSSSVFEKDGEFSHAVAYNATSAAKQCEVYDASGNVVAAFNVPAHTLTTFPELSDNGQQPDGCYNLLPATATASSGDASAAIDGNRGSRWESAFEDPQSITVDLGVVSHVDKITLIWEAANAKNYTLLGSVDGENWETIAEMENMAEEERTDVVDGISADYQYIQMYGTERNTPYGYSIYEIEICGEVAAAPIVAGVKLPAKIEAEDYISMQGVQAELTADAGGGENLGWIEAGDWMEYQVNSAEDQDYQLDLRVASPDETGVVEVLIDDELAAVIDVPFTGGYQAWETVSAQLKVSKGLHIVRVKAASAPFNLNWIAFADVTSAARLSAEQSVNASMSVFPNPADDVLKVLSVTNDEITIINSRGEVLIKQQGTKGVNNIDVSGLVPGIYLVKSGSTAQKVIIK